jgi:hypothetical protein
MTTTQVPTKSQSSKNAVTHGLYASEVVLPEESQKEFDDLLEAYRDEYCPHGISEHATVDELAILHWKRRRLETGLQQALQELKLCRVDTSDELVEQIRSAQMLQLEPVKQIAASVQGQKLDQATAQAGLIIEVEKLNAALKEYSIRFHELASSRRLAQQQMFEDIVQAHLPDILERELKIQAEIDRRTEKLLKRLAIIKTYKGFVSKPANANQIEAAATKPHSTNGC